MSRKLAPFHTPLSKELGLKYPIVSAPMFLVSNADMLVEASKVGILGAMPALNARTHEDFRNLLEDVNARAKGPYAINLMIKFDGGRLDDDLNACIEHKVPVIITSLGLPTDVVKKAHQHGMLVFHDVINERHAKKVDAIDIDGIIAVAYGAGGHAGLLNPFVLAPYLRDRVKAPIILSGCINGGRQVLASLSLGAQLAYVGTRFIATTESGAQEDFKEMMLSHGPEDLVYSDEVSGTKANWLKASYDKFKEALARGEKVNRWKDVYSSGQGVGLIGGVKPLKEVVEDMVAEYWDAYDALPKAE